MILFLNSFNFNDYHLMPMTLSRGQAIFFFLGGGGGGVRPFGRAVLSRIRIQVLYRPKNRVILK